MVFLSSLENDSIREKIIWYFARKLEEDLSGHSDKEAIVLGLPSEKFSIAILSPHSDRVDPRLRNKLAPSSCSLVFHLPSDVPNNATISIETKGAFYFRIYPNYEEQLKFSGSGLEGGQGLVQLLTVFARTSFEHTHEIRARDLLNSKGWLNIELSETCHSLWEKAETDSSLFRPFEMKGRKKGSSHLPPLVLRSKEEYIHFLLSTKKVSFPCQWHLIVSLRATQTEDGYRITARLENGSPETSGDFRENAFFESKLTLRIRGASFSPFELQYLEEDYRHDRKILAYGINCTSRALSENEVSSEHTPLHVENRLIPTSPPCLTFDKLESDPVKHLSEASRFLREQIDRFKSQEDLKWTPSQREAFAKDCGNSDIEYRRFVEGIEVLEKYSEALTAFKLMTKAFRKSSKGIEGWRLFQAVFIVSLIPDLVAREHPEIPNSRDLVDLLFYPTGGGKTEAFLGLSIFQAFYDRMCGKTSGITAIAKFPLRMLSIQQLQRIADAFASAEIIRRQNPSLLPPNSEPFSVGYYVGARNTPNELEDWDDATRRFTVTTLTEWEQSPEKAQKFLVVSRCPFCLSEGVQIKADPKAIRLYHWCSNQKCPSGGPLPIYITDNEIYRYLPTFVVSTLDKMVTCGHQKKFRSILGQALYKCKLHGYTSEGKCAVRSCSLRAPDLESCDLQNALPSIMIQDELHLVRESLGCFASHYETFLDYLIKRLGSDKERIKIIGATATASNFQSHIWNLYLRDPIKFPSIIEIFSEKTTKLARLTIGIMPHGKTAIFAMEQVLTTLKSEVERLSKLPLEEASSVLDLDSSQNVNKELQDFQTFLSYHIRKIDAEQLNRSVWSRINPSIVQRGYSEIRYANLTGDVSFDRVRKVMNQIESGHEGGIGLLTATSLISHGVDVDKLNLMVFMGMPGSNAEYLQAKSRIARKNAGLVVMVFIPGRERDHSYFRYFTKFHELHDLLIEPVPINRWAPLALARTSVGIFSACIYNFFDFVTTRDHGKPIWKVEWLRSALSEKLLTQDEIINFVLESYGIRKLQGSARAHVEEILKNKIESCLTTILTTESKWENIAGVLEPRPLMSLRDVGSDVSIELNHESRFVVERFKINADILETWA